MDSYKGLSKRGCIQSEPESISESLQKKKNNHSALTNQIPSAWCINEGITILDSRYTLSYDEKGRVVDSCWYHDISHSAQCFHTEYDSVNRISSIYRRNNYISNGVEKSDSSIENYQYFGHFATPDSILVSDNLGDKRSINYKYDSQGRIVERCTNYYTSSNSAECESYSYDNLNHLVSVKNDHMTEYFSYDIQERIIVDSIWINPSGCASGYDRDVTHYFYNGKLLVRKTGMYEIDDYTYTLSGDLLIDSTFQKNASGKVSFTKSTVYTCDGKGFLNLISQFDSTGDLISKTTMVRNTDKLIQESKSYYVQKSQNVIRSIVCNNDSSCAGSTDTCISIGAEIGDIIHLFCHNSKLLISMGNESIDSILSMWNVDSTSWLYYKKDNAGLLNVGLRFDKKGIYYIFAQGSSDEISGMIRIRVGTGLVIDTKKIEKSELSMIEEFTDAQWIDVFTIDGKRVTRIDMSKKGVHLNPAQLLDRVRLSKGVYITKAGGEKLSRQPFRCIIK